MKLFFCGSERLHGGCAALIPNTAITPQTLMTHKTQIVGEKDVAIWHLQAPPASFFVGSGSWEVGNLRCEKRKHRQGSNFLHIP